MATADVHQAARSGAGAMPSPRGTQDVLEPPRAGVVMKNWAEVHHAAPAAYYEPDTVAAVSELVRLCISTGRTLRVIGAGHSPNDCAMCDDVMVSLKRLNRVLVVNAERCQVKVEAGISLGDLCEALDRNGLALPNLGSICEQSLAGAIATGTHGTGAALGIIATAVVELQMVDGSGAVVTASEKSNPDLFRAALCSFGCLGIVTGAVLQVVPAFDLRAVEHEVPLADVLSSWRQRAASSRHYRFWWFPHTDMALEWRGDPVPPRLLRQGYEPPEAAAARSAPLRLLHAARVTVNDSLASARAWFWGMLVGYHLFQAALWLGLFVPAAIPWINRLWRRLLFAAPATAPRTRVDRSDRVFTFNCLFRQHVNEWSVPAEALPQAMARLQTLLTRLGHKAHFPVEVRFVAGDGIWLSPCYSAAAAAANTRGSSSGTADSPSGPVGAAAAPSAAAPSTSAAAAVSTAPAPLFAWIGIIAYKPYGMEPEFAAYFAEFEREMAALGGRPHWAKDFALAGDAGFAGLYPRWGDFKALRATADPHGVFVNAFVRRTLGLPSHAHAAKGRQDGAFAPAPASGGGAASTAAAAAAASSTTQVAALSSINHASSPTVRA